NSTASEHGGQHHCHMAFSGNIAATNRTPHATDSQCKQEDHTCSRRVTGVSHQSRPPATERVYDSRRHTECQPEHTRTEATTLLKERFYWCFITFLHFIQHQLGIVSNDLRRGNFLNNCVCLSSFLLVGQIHQ